MTVRVGHIGFLNCYPLYHGFEQTGMLADDRHIDLPGRPGVELLPGVPTDLNRMLVAGEIDLGPVSSIAYARNHTRLLLSRRLSISSLGAVDSIQLVTRRPLDGDPDGGPHSAERHFGRAAQDHPQAAIPAARLLLRARWVRRRRSRDARRRASDRRPGSRGSLLPRPGDHLLRPGRSVAGVDRACPWSTPSGRRGRISPARTAPNSWGGGGVGAVHGLRTGSSVRSGGVGARPVSFRPRVSHALFRPPSLRLHRRVSRGLVRFYELACEAGELEEVPGAALHRRGRRGGAPAAGGGAASPSEGAAGS